MIASTRCRRRSSRRFSVSRRAFSRSSCVTRGSPRALPAPRLRGEPGHPLPPPGHQMRRVEAFLPQHRRHFPRLGTRIRFAQNLELVLRRISAARPVSTSGSGFASRPEGTDGRSMVEDPPLRAASLRSASLRAGSSTIASFVTLVVRKYCVRAVFRTFFVDHERQLTSWRAYAYKSQFINKNFVLKSIAEAKRRMSQRCGPPSPAGPRMARRQIDVEAVRSTVGRSRAQRMSGNRTSRRPWDRKPVVAASTWGSSRPRVCSGSCAAEAPTEPASGGSSSAPGCQGSSVTCPNVGCWRVTAAARRVTLTPIRNATPASDRRARPGRPGSVRRRW